MVRSLAWIALVASLLVVARNQVERTSLAHAATLRTMVVRPDQTIVVPFTVIGQGFASCLMHPIYIKIVGQQQWEMFWNGELHRGASSPPPLPQIDFNHDMVVVVDPTTPRTSVGVERIVKTGRNLTVFARQTPDRDQAGNPFPACSFQAVVVPKAPRVNFVVEQDTGPCGGDLTALCAAPSTGQDITAGGRCHNSPEEVIKAVCYTPSRAYDAVRSLPFTPVDPSPVVRRRTHLQLTRLIVEIWQPTLPQPRVMGITYIYGPLPDHLPATNHYGNRPGYVYVSEYVLADHQPVTPIRPITERDILHHEWSKQWDVHDTATRYGPWEVLGSVRGGKVQVFVMADAKRAIVWRLGTEILAG